MSCAHHCLLHLLGLRCSRALTQSMTTALHVGPPLLPHRDTSTPVCRYERVSANKEQVFPPAYFGNLVDLLELSISARRIVPVLHNAKHRVSTVDMAHHRKKSICCVHPTRKIEDDVNDSDSFNSTFSCEAGKHVTSLAAVRLDGRS